MIKKIRGITIEVDAIAKGFIDMIGEDNRTILAFGMIPHDFFKLFMKEIKMKVATDYTAPGKLYEGLEPADIVEYIDKDIIREIEHELSVAIYRNAEMVV